MKEKEAKRIAAKKRLEEKNKKKTEEENAMRKGEALQVSAPGGGGGGARLCSRCPSVLGLNAGFFVLRLISEKAMASKRVTLNFFRHLKNGKRKS